MTRPAKSLTAQFRALDADRERAKLAGNVNQRRVLVDAFGPAKVRKAGDRVPLFELEPSASGTLSRDELLADGPVLVELAPLALAVADFRPDDRHSQRRATCSRAPPPLAAARG